MTNLRRGGIVAAVVTAVSLVGLAVPASASTDPVEDTKQALGHGDSATAAELITENGFDTQPELLGEILVGAGNIAVSDGYGDEVGQTIADAFLAAEIDIVTAQLAYVHGVTVVADQALTNPQILRLLAPGGLAVLRTELAYLGITLPILPVSILPLPLLPLPLF